MSSKWFVDKVLPSVVIAIILGLFAVAISVEQLEHSTMTFRQASKEYRDTKQVTDALQTEKILKNMTNIAHMQKCRSQDGVK
jgi:hypothetical protein